MCTSTDWLSSAHTERITSSSPTPAAATVSKSASTLRQPTSGAVSLSLVRKPCTPRVPTKPPKSAMPLISSDHEPSWKNSPSTIVSVMVTPPSSRSSPSTWKAIIHAPSVSNLPVTLTISSVMKPMLSSSAVAVSTAVILPPWARSTEAPSMVKIGPCPRKGSHELPGASCPPSEKAPVVE